MEQYKEERPWGSFTVLVDEHHFKTKRLDVLAGKRLSLQSHYRRSEHWIIVTGQARITIGDNTGTFTAAGHVFVPKETVHRIENTGDTLLTIVEVQLGDYFGEDDIVRYEDDFDRHK